MIMEKKNNKPDPSSNRELEKILDLRKKKNKRGMYKMVNFPITFGEFFFVVVVVVAVFCQMIMGPLQKNVKKMHLQGYYHCRTKVIR